MRIIDAYMTAPRDVQADDVALYVIKAIIMYDGTYRLYQCPYAGPTDEDRLPQGNRIGGGREKAVAKAIFPMLARTREPDSQR